MHSLPRAGARTNAVHTGQLPPFCPYAISVSDRSTKNAAQGACMSETGREGWRLYARRSSMLSKTSRGGSES